MYFKFTATLIFWFLGFLASAQKQIKEYVKQKAVTIASIDPGLVDYSDLEAIGDAIGEAKIVMMGEQDHGDAPGFFAKTRLIKYLHERKGFNVVAVEGDFININYDWKQVTEGKLSVERFVKKNIPADLISCKGSSPFFSEYLPGTLNANPIEVAGFDAYTSTPQAIPLLDSMMRKLQLPITRAPEYTSEILPLLHSYYKYANDTMTTDKIIGYYNQIKTELMAKLPSDDFWIMAVDNLIAGNEEIRNLPPGVWHMFKDRNIRDRQMAINLKWLSEVKYPRKKIIVWAHNYHVSKYAGHYNQAFLNKARTMGTVFTEDLSHLKNTYIIGFTSYRGTAGRMLKKTYTVPKPKAKSFENWIKRNVDYAFVDFKRFNEEYPGSNEPFWMKCSMTSPFHRNEFAQWTKIFDGVFFIRDTYSCNQ